MSAGHLNGLWDTAFEQWPPRSGILFEVAVTHVLMTPVLSSEAHRARAGDQLLTQRIRHDWNNSLSLSVYREIGRSPKTAHE